MDYRVYGFDQTGARHEVTSTPSARVARTYRDAGNSPWDRVEVFGADGALSVEQLNRLAEIDHRYS